MKKNPSTAQPRQLGAHTRRLASLFFERLNMPRSKYFCVVSPPHLYHEIIVDGQGPYYEECDVVEVYAQTAKDAKAFAVRIVSKEPHKYEHIRTCRSDGVSPYTGLKVYNAKGKAV